MTQQAKKPHVGAIGFEIWIETRLDLTTASSIKFRYRKPDESVGEFVATFDNRAGPRSSTRYGAKYITTGASDLDQAGEWEFQVLVTLPGFTGPGEIATLEVGEAL